MIAPPAIYAEPVSYEEKTTSFSGSKAPREVNIVEHFMLPVEAEHSFGLINQIEKFQYLKENWDGYGATVPSRNAISNAKAFIRLLPKVFSDGVAKDFIFPTPYGTIIIEWTNDENSLTVEIGDHKIGLVSDINNNPEILIDGKSFDEQELPLEFIQGLFRLYSSFQKK